MLKILGRNTSINVQKVMWAIGELGIPHERVDVGGAFGRTKEPFYLAMNPNSLVPTLEEDGFILWESNSIVRYLDAQLGKTKFAAGDAFSMGDIPVGLITYRFRKLVPDRTGMGLDNLERWYLGLEQRKAFQEQILPVPFT